MQMVNTQLFQTVKGMFTTKADAVNEAGGKAYQLSAKQELAQLASTGCLNSTFYTNAESQVDAVLKLAGELEASFIAKTAVYARKAGYMKDMPALLAASLAMRDVNILAKNFTLVIDNGKMLRNFVQIMRSGVVGRKSLGTRPKKLIQLWLLQATEAQLLQASVGNTPSLADVVKMVHPKPVETWRAAWFAWLIGKEYSFDALPPITQEFERFKQDREQAVPDVPFQMLTALDLDTKAWAHIASKGSWQMVRQNLNTFARHGVFEVPGMAEQVANKLRNAESIAKAHVLPYQLMSAYTAADDLVPQLIKGALQDAMEIAIANVPEIEGGVVVCPDVSGSMQSSVTGTRKGATSKVRCIDVAALVAAALLRKNHDASVMPFEVKVVDVKLNPRDSVMTNAEKLASIGGGGTACSAPLVRLNQERAKAGLVVLVSDNESWADRHRGQGSALMHEWNTYKQRNPLAKLVCIDIQPHATSPAYERVDVLNIGGFSDEVFKLLAVFAAGRMDPEHWVKVIEETALSNE
jgi:60 kDa SS-A/Ro ribonucleoprotein